ncbi:MAG TPA: DUF502 domain-containing protein, partial [Rhodocyclaceae bacterium]|nr:DUF502 domain-containing protein [Rhodocyclaceae bacterium]
LSIVINTMDQSIRLIPTQFRPLAQIGFDIPGLGTILTLLIIFVTGLVTANILGQQIVKFWEAALGRIPVVKSIYYSVKQVSDTLFSGNGDAFRQVLLVRYPHPEAWSIAFQTGEPARDVSSRLSDDYVAVFIPTAPSPVNGFFFFVKRADTLVLDMSVDEALKYIVSMGVVSPTHLLDQGGKPLT